jgi:lipopolysaccharide transport system ATP-binding protein
MEKEVLIKAEGVSKKFCRILKKSLIYGGRDIVMGFLGIEKNQELRPDEF